MCVSVCLLRGIKNKRHIIFTLVTLQLVVVKEELVPFCTKDSQPESHNHTSIITYLTCLLFELSHGKH